MNGDKKNTILICTIAYEDSLTISTIVTTMMKWPEQLLRASGSLLVVAKIYL